MHKPFRSSLWILLIFFCLVAPEYSRADQDSSALLLRLVGPDGGERSVTREDWASCREPRSRQRTTEAMSSTSRVSRPVSCSSLSPRPLDMNCAAGN